MDPLIYTFGCKVNSYDSGLIEKWLKGDSFGVDPKNIHILNTCAVTQSATQEAVRAIRKIKAKNPLATVVVTGCAAQVDTKYFEKLPGADLVVANSHKSQLGEILRNYFKGTLKEKVIKSNIFKKEDLEIGGGENSRLTRSFLKIQDGCNSFCSYCIIPYARGKSRSVPVAQLIERIQELSSQGTREIVLTGIHIGDYQDDKLSGLDQNSKNPSNYQLASLMSEILKNTSKVRFRLSSLEPLEVDEALLEVFQDSRLCPHFHMSIQSAESGVLKSMKRNYGKKEVQDSLSRIEKMLPQSFVGMDVIVGFPTESNSNFQETYATLKDLFWTKIHVFPYSEREGTRATILENLVNPSEKSQRAAVLRELSSQRYERQARNQIGKVKSALVLNKKGRGSDALSEDYWPIQIEGAEDFIDHWKGEIVPVKIKSYNPQVGTLGEGVLVGTLSV
ncbi:MAG TPA: tRNA (N(6)-L-threonylcarbamoyladenosine(37)-C(2))-methylthiotransferase MtaB [Pseudobdellovibrionaceae bacterium]|nr:tRNA (N(6)-L-threonylcarbamoyladenosine(37)-C(2))-methylthiotransferase MtaB [Pseudobdellovibrionaceae bacterium]